MAQQISPGAIVNTIRIALCSVALSLLQLPGIVAAQAVPVDRFSLAERPDDAFHAARLGRFGHGRFGIALAGDYAWNPLLLDAPRGDDLQIIERQLGLHASISASIANRLILFAGVNASALMEGDEIRSAFDDLVSPADGAGLGDTRLGARVLLIGADDSLFALGAQLAVTLPTAELAKDDQRYLGESAVALTPTLILELRSELIRVSVNAGAHVRRNASYLDTTIGDEFRYALAVGVRPAPVLELLAEGYGVLSFDDPGARDTSLIEWLGGLKLHVPAGFTAGVAAGTGLRPAFGSPDARVVLMLGWLTEGHVERRETPTPSVPLDTDYDGVPNLRDKCVDEPEDRDQFMDDDGCPDPDNDMDGVRDEVDRCPAELEDVDQHEDADGCPDPDNDGDGAADAQDRCPNEAEDRDDYEDDDGCPELDNDKDGVPDSGDDCPLEPGSAAEKGCPKAIRVEDGNIRLLQQINFANNSDVILPDGTPILEEISAALGANARIAHIRIEGHTDDRGSDKKNLELSKRRAASVAKWLIDHGTASDRVEAWGCGEVQPIESNKKADGRAKNRRVVFHITDPAPTAGALAPAVGCQPVNAPK
jgi:outer membrane protein OmpA-like peptidoglycan-associated protein